MTLSGAEHKADGRLGEEQGVTQQSRHAVGVYHDGGGEKSVHQVVLLPVSEMKGGNAATILLKMFSAFRRN